MDLRLTIAAALVAAAVTAACGLAAGRAALSLAEAHAPAVDVDAILADGR